MHQHHTSIWTTMSRTISKTVTSESLWNASKLYNFMTPQHTTRGTGWRKARGLYIKLLPAPCAWFKSSGRWNVSEMPPNAFFRSSALTWSYKGHTHVGLRQHQLSRFAWFAQQSQHTHHIQSLDFITIITTNTAFGFPFGFPKSSFPVSCLWSQVQVFILAGNCIWNRLRVCSYGFPQISIMSRRGWRDTISLDRMFWPHARGVECCPVHR